jgi:uncharacterized membrane protein YkgB
MSDGLKNVSGDFSSRASGLDLAHAIGSAGRAVALSGVVLPLFLIGILKFTQIEVEALKPIIGGTPWLSWLYPAFGEAGASYLLGVVELFTAALLAASPWSARAALVGGAVATLTFAVTVSTLFALPIWEAGSGGFPWLNATGSFLIKDVALLGVSLVALAEGLERSRGRAPHARS